MGAIDPDITTFAGEGAVFVIGNYSDTANNFKMFLNIHRGGAEGYTHIQIFNEDDDESTATPLEEETLADDSSYVVKNNDIDSNSQSTDVYRVLNGDADDDWIVYNLAKYWSTLQANNTGKFKARVVRKESNSVIVYSGCTHFEFIKIEVSINTETNKFGFIVKGGTPVQYRIESENGMIAYAATKNLALTDYTTENDVHTGINLTIPSTWNSGYIRLFVKTDYGMANRRIAYTKPNT